MLYAAAPTSAALAGVSTADRVIDLQAAEKDRHTVSGFLGRDDVRRQMIDLGVDPADVSHRVNALSDGEMSALAAKIDEMPAGEGTVGILIVTTVLLFAVLAVTDAMGVTDVLPFINAQDDRHEHNR
jgi:hypothetical protein